MQSDILTKVTSPWWYEQLKKYDEPVRYLKSRGINGITARWFGIGYNPPGYQLLTTLKALGYGDKDCEFLTTSGGYDFFGGYLTFPIINRSKQVVSITSRYVGSNENAPPHLHMHGTCNIAFNWRSIKHTNQYIYVVESPIDAMTLFQLGYRNVVALTGVSGIKRILSHAKPEHRFVFIPDNDKNNAGYDGMIQNAVILYQHGIRYIYYIPTYVLHPYKDINELYCKGTDNDIIYLSRALKWQKAIEYNDDFKKLNVKKSNPYTYVNNTYEDEDIVIYIGAHTQLKQHGSKWYGKCVFHNDGKPSLVVYPETSSWFCFGCRKGGNLRTFKRLIGK